MKRTLFLAVFVGLFAVAALAQDKKTDFSGGWTLDVEKSKLGERARIESMTMTVTQTAADVTVATSVKRLPPPADAGQGGGMRPPGGGMGGGMRGGMGGFGDGTFSYTLDGRESSVETDGPMGKVPVKLKAELGGDGRLKLVQTRTMNTQMGEFTLTTRETWELSADGKTLTVKREMDTPRGSNTTEMIFAKQ